MDFMIGLDRWRGATSLAVLSLALGASGGAAAAQALAPPQADLAAAPSASEAPARFDIQAFQVKGNNLLSADEVERAVYPFMGPGRTADDVEHARAALQKAFEDKGYIAVSVFIPEQAADRGVLLLEVQPQAINQVLVEGAKHPEAVRILAPSLKPGLTPNLPAFQRDVVALNQSPNRKVTPELRAGEAPGTLDVVLTVEESSAAHASLELNNYSSGATSDLRTSASARYDNLWGRGDSLSISAQTAPQRPDDGTVLSANYMMRLGAGTQFLAYAVHSDSDIAVVGGTSVIGKGDMVGLRLIRSLGSREGFYHSLTVGLDWKNFSEDVILGADRASAPIEYWPITASWRGDWSGERRRSDLTLSTVFGFRGLGAGKWTFDAKRYQARPNFFIVKLDASHTEDVVHDLQITTRLTGQWSPDPLISNEGFSLGGMQTVRGYYESEALGDYGLAIQTQIASPDLAPRLGGAPIDELRFHVFWDSGVAAIHAPLAGQSRDFFLMSAGLGAQARLLNYLNGAVDVGAPLVSSSDSTSGSVFARFRIWGEF